MSTQHRWKPIMETRFYSDDRSCSITFHLCWAWTRVTYREKRQWTHRLQRELTELGPNSKPSSTYTARVCPPLDYRGQLNSPLWILHNFNTKQASKALQLHLCQSTTNCSPRELHMPAAGRPLPFLLLLLLMSHPMPSIPSGTQLFQKVCQQRQGQQPG